MRVGTITAVAVRTAEAGVRRFLRMRVRPYKVLLELTAECNSRCGSCAIWRTPAAKKRREIDLGHIEGLFRSLGTDLRWLALSGGEVTLYDQFPEVIELARRHCPKLRLVTFTTNGLLPQRALEWALVVQRAGFDEFVTISLDGDRKTHDEIRGVEGNSDLAWEAHRLLRLHGVRAHFGITLSERNASFVANGFAKLADKLKAVTILHSGGIYGQHNQLEDDAIAASLRTVYRHYEPRSVGELLEKAYIKLSGHFVASRRSRNVVPCAVGHTSLHVRPEGQVGVCMFMPELGNIKDGGSIRDMLSSSRARRMLADIARGDCPHCWMNCYAPHSMLASPLHTLRQWLKAVPANAGQGHALARGASGAGGTGGIQLANPSAARGKVRLPLSPSTAALPGDATNAAEAEELCDANSAAVV